MPKAHMPGGITILAEPTILQAYFLLKTCDSVEMEPYLLNLQEVLNVFDMQQKIEFSVQVCLPFLSNSDIRADTILF